MTKLRVNGLITINGARIASYNDTCKFLTGTTLYDSKSLSTGAKTTLESFSGYKTLAIGVYSTATEGYAWQFMPLEIFKLSADGSFYIQQNIASQNRRLRLYYVNSNGFYISYLDGADGLKIIGYP